MASGFALPPIELPYSALGSLVISIQDPTTGVRYPAHLEAVEQFYRQSIELGIHFGARIGAGIAMSALLFLLSANSNSLLHVLYQTNLAIMVLDSVLQTAYLQAFATSIGEFILQIPPDNRSKALSVCATIFFDLNVVTLICTLIAQINAAFSDMSRKIRIGVLALCSVAAFPCVLIHIWGLVISSIFSYHPEEAHINEYGIVTRYRWVLQSSWSVFAATVATFSAVLCLKLWVASRNRVRLGLEKWDPVRIVLTMAYQNSVISAIILIATAATPQSSSSRTQLGAAALPITVVLMPLGYVWAQISAKRAPSPLDQSIQTDTYPVQRSPSSPNSESDVFKYVEKADHRINGRVLDDYQV